ncbi:unnamed protein product [Rotaria sp. Silwood1]|nr:unnamed protein product [Rotaria sp. Silwood1]
MKFLRDLKLLKIIDEEQEQEDPNQHKFHLAIDEDLDLDAYNELFKTKELQSNISEQHKQDYLEKLKLILQN